MTFIGSQHNAANTLTKVEGHYALIDAFNSKKLFHLVEKWIIQEYGRGAKLTDSKMGMEKYGVQKIIRPIIPPNYSTFMTSYSIFLINTHVLYWYKYEISFNSLQK